MKKTNENKTWNFNFYNGSIEINFTESVDIRKAFAAMIDTTNDVSWLDELNGKETDTDTFEMSCMMYSTDDVGESIRNIITAIAETFPTVPFNGSVWYDAWKCYCDIDYEFSYNDGILNMTESFADEDHGYFCPECGAWILRVTANENYDADEEIECGECEESFKLSDLKFVPPTVTNYEIKIG